MTTIYVEHVCVDKSTRPGAASICVECLGANDLKKTRDGLFGELCRQMKKRGIPDHLQGGLARYLLGGIRPGHFLTSVLENDLSLTMRIADEESRASLRSILCFLYEDAPAKASGSGKRVAVWMHEMTDEQRVSTIGDCIQ